MSTKRTTIFLACLILFVGVINWMLDYSVLDLFESESQARWVISCTIIGLAIAVFSRWLMQPTEEYLVPRGPRRRHVSSIS